MESALKHPKNDKNKSIVNLIYQTNSKFIGKKCLDFFNHQKKKGPKKKERHDIEKVLRDVFLFKLNMTDVRLKEKQLGIRCASRFLADLRRVTDFRPFEAQVLKIRKE